MAIIKANFTDALVREWIAEAKAKKEKGRVEYQDTKVPYLRLRVTSAGAVFTGYMWHPVKKTPVRETFAPTTIMNVTTARDKAREFGADTRGGVDVAARKRAERDAAKRGRLTLRHMHESDVAQLESEGAPLRPASVDMYAKQMPALFGALYDAPFDTITEAKLRALIVERMRKRKVPTKTGASTRVVGSSFGALVACDRMSALCKRFKVADPSADLRQNWKQFPVKGERPGRVDTEELAPLFAWLVAQRDRTSTSAGQKVQCTMLMLAMATGWRRLTLQQLRWEFFNFKAKRIELPEHIMKTNKPHTVPMAGVIADHIFPAGTRAASGLMFPQMRDEETFGDFTPRFLQSLPIKCSAQDFRQAGLALFDDAPNAGAFGAKLLLGHNSGDVSFTNYIKNTPLPTRMRKMQSVVDYVDTTLSSRIGDRKAIKALDALHYDRRQAMLEYQRQYSRASKARQRAARAAKRAAASA